MAYLPQMPKYNPPQPTLAEIEANIERDSAEWLAKQRAIFAKRWAEVTK